VYHAPLVLHEEVARQRQQQLLQEARRGPATRNRRGPLRPALALGAIVLAVVVAAFLGSARPASASTERHEVALHLVGTIVGPATVTGTWSATGAVQDHGTYTEVFNFNRDGTVVDVGKVLTGQHGTIVYHAHAHVVAVSDTRRGFVRGTWRIEFGTGAYTGLHGGGRPATTADSWADLASGQVDVTHEGLVSGIATAP
jgi:hypothetical protein